MLTPSPPPHHHRFSMNKAFGQHILKNPSVIANIIAKAKIK